MTQFLNATLLGLTLGMVYAAFALALVLIFRSTRIINFGQGAQAMFSTYVGLAVINATDSYWLGLAVALVSGLVLGAVVERVLIRPLDPNNPLAPVIVTLGLFVALEALAAIVFGNSYQSFPAPFSLRGFQVGDVNLALTPNNIYFIVAVLLVMGALVVLFQRTNLGLSMRAAAFSQEVARLLGVRVGRLLTLGWALAGLVGSLAGFLIASNGTFIFPQYMESSVVFGFAAAVIGGLDSTVGAVVGGLVLGLTVTYVSTIDFLGSELVTLSALTLLLLVLLVRPQGLFSSSVTRKV